MTRFKADFQYPLIHRRRDGGPPSPQSSAKPSGRRLVFFLRTTSSKISRGAGENEIMPFPFAKTIVLLLHGSPSAYSLAIKDCSVTRTCELKVTVDRAGNEIMPFPFAKLFQQFCGNLGVCRLLYAIDTRTCEFRFYSFPAPQQKDKSMTCPFAVERETRFELATFALARQRSTTEPFPHNIQ